MLRISNNNNFYEASDTIEVEELNRRITEEEIIKTISSMKRHKSPDLDNNVADFLIDSKILSLSI